jgi:putative transposase
MHAVGMGSFSEYGHSSGAVHSLGYHLVWYPKYRHPVLGGRAADLHRKRTTSPTLREEFLHPRSRLPILWSKWYFVASVERVSEAMIRRHTDEQTARPTKGVP